MTTLQVWLAIGAVVLVDQLSKWWATQAGLVSLNTGVAFGLAQGQTIILLFILVFLVGYYVWYHSSQHKLWPLILVMGGALSNILDRLLFGGVKDWLPVPFFDLQNNLADYAVVVGLLWSWFYYMRKDDSSTTQS